MATATPHSDFGDPDCCGCFSGIIFDKGCADIECNECGTVIRTVPAADLEHALDEMELSVNICAEMCPHCCRVNVFSRFSKMMAYTCRECVEIVRPSDDPETGQIFGPEQDQD